MPFLGKSPTAGFASIVKDDLTPNGSTTAFTLSKQVANANDIAVFLGNVRQEPTDAYTVSGTTLTMSEAPASGLNFYVLHIAGTHESSVVPADGTISSAKIANNTVTTAHLHTGFTLAASKLTGALPALDGSALTGVSAGSTEIISSSNTGASGVGSVEISLSTDDKYRSQKLVMFDYYGSQVQDNYLRLRRTGQSSFNSGGSDYKYITSSREGTSGGGLHSTGASSFRWPWAGVSNTLDKSVGMLEWEFFKSNITGAKTTVAWRRLGLANNANQTQDIGSGRFESNDEVDRIVLYAAAGTISYSSYTLYGILRS